MIRFAGAGLAATMLAVSPIAISTDASADPAYDAMIAKHAAANDVPESLIRRVIKRESGFRPGIVSKGNYGLMQIKPATARSMGYTGSPQGLLDADTNMTYAVKYLAGAYRVAGGNHDRAVSNYARGYYYAAKRQGGLAKATTTPNLFQTAAAPAESGVNAPQAKVAQPSMAPVAAPTSDTNAASAAAAGVGSGAVVLRPDSMTAFAQTQPEKPRKQRRQKVEKPLNLLEIFTPQPANRKAPRT